MPLTIPASLRDALTRPVAVFGAGLSGEGVQSLLRVLGIASVVYDQKGKKFLPEHAALHRLAVFSPGFSSNHPWPIQACAAELECIGELDFASLFWRGKKVVVTGTNGKTTLTEFLTHALRAAGESAHAVGNIGHPFSRLAAERAGGQVEELAICEVSSFQAETLQYLQSDATLWTNFAEDHLERHRNMEIYFSAKWTVVLRTAADGLFVGSSVRDFALKHNRLLPASSWVATEGLPEDPRLAGTVFAEYPQRENFVLAEAWWKASGRDPAALCQAAKSFRLAPHRLTRIAERDGVGFWNDSKATNFHAVEAALGRFTKPVLLIAGGKPKGGDAAAFVERIAPRVRKLFLIGEASPVLAEACVAGQIPHVVCVSMEDAVRQAAADARSGEDVLLSPGFASFDLFRNYEDRGNQFERIVQDLVAPTNLR